MPQPTASEIEDARELLALADRELELRAQRRLFATRGWRDEAGVLQGGLMAFVRAFWHVLEPETPFVDGWVLWAIVEHLEAVSYNEINRLLINVPPGTMKSLLTNAFWPAWEWATQRTSLRYVTFSYASTLTERDNGRFRALVTDAHYSALYPDIKLERFGDTKVANTQTGWKFASSVEGVGTGERGDRVLCFPGDTLVRTENGSWPIGELVEHRIACRVLAYNVENGRMTWRWIKRWFENPASDLVEVGLSDGTIVKCTPGHRIWTRRGWVSAALLQSSDRVPCFPLANLLDGFAGDTESLGQFARRRRRVQDEKHLWGLQFGPSASLTPMDVRSVADCNASPCLAAANLCNDVATDAITICEHFGVLAALCDGISFIARKFRSRALFEKRESAVELSVFDVFSTSSITEVAQRVVRWVTVEMANFVFCRRRSYESKHNSLVYESVDRTSVGTRVKAWVSAFSWRGVENAKWNFEGAGASTNNAVLASDATAGGYAVDSDEAGDRSPLFVRWCGHAEKTYCLGVEGDHTFFVGEGNSVLVANCDDPHKVDESKLVVEKTVGWFRRAMLNRLNDQTRSAVVVIMQRVHESDVSGTILSLEMDFVHLMIPMEFDSERACETAIGWRDPRVHDGELAWPERFSSEEVAKLKKNLGPAAFAAQYQQSPTPAGGGIISASWWQLWCGVGDDDRPRSEGDDAVIPGRIVELMVASLDGAFTEKEENDPSALTVWAIVRVRNEQGLWRRRIVLAHAWRRFLAFSGERALVDRRVGESLQAWRWRTRGSWGLIEWVKDTCEMFHVNTLLIEAKGPGISAAQELQRRYGDNSFGVVLCPVKGDKMARTLAVQPTFSQGMVYAPDREWAQLVIDECEVFPRGTRDDLCDSTTQAMKWLRDNGLAQADVEASVEERERVTHRPQRRALYPC